MGGEFLLQLFVNRASHIGGEFNLLMGNSKMARSKNIENMSYAELAAMQARIERVKVDKQNSERTELRQKLSDMAKQHGFDIHELFGRGPRARAREA